jgi:hypothetical protein
VRSVREQRLEVADDVVDLRQDRVLERRLVAAQQFGRPWV